MDVYHNADIFVRRMLYKPNWWKDYFSSESYPEQTTILPVRDSTATFWDIPYGKSENRDDSCNCDTMVKVKFADNEKLPNKETRNPVYNIQKQLVKVKMADVAVKQKSKIINVESLKSPNTDIYNTMNSFYLNSNNQQSRDAQNLNITIERQSYKPKQQNSPNNSFDECPFQKYSSDSPPSPIPSPDKIKITCKERIKKRTRTVPKPRKIPSGRNKYSKLLNEEASVPHSVDGKIIKDLVLERFIVNINKLQQIQDQENSLKLAENKLKTDVNDNFQTDNNRTMKNNENIFFRTENSKYINDKNSYNLIEHERRVESENISKNEDTTQSTYDAEKFLKMALGDEIPSTPSTSMSDVEIVEKNNNKDKKSSFSSGSLTDNELTNSIGTAEASILLSEREVPSLVINFEPQQKLQLENIQEDVNPSHNKRITALMQQAAEQHYHMQQASKALSVCRVTKEFTFSHERLEAERLLLLAVTKNRAILDEINRLDLDDNCDSNLQQGILTISDICVPLNNIKNNISLQKRFDNFSQWFLLVASCGSQVYASKIVTPDTNFNLTFNESMTFDHLPPDFVFNINVYYLEQPKNIRNFSHASKYHLDQNYKCPTPKQFFKKHVCKQSPVVSRVALNDYIRTPAFKLAGHLKINLNNLHVQGNRELKQVHAYLQGVVTMNISTNLQINIHHSGFLTLGSVAGGYPSWSRYWCVLEGHCLKYWNYPSEVDTKNPIDVIDLKKCVTAWIDTVDSEICSKPRTLLLETVRHRSPSDEDSLIIKCMDEEHTIVRHLLCCDTEADLRQWAKQLNLVVSFLRNWNLIEKI